jgi:hypothetical protein
MYIRARCRRDTGSAAAAAFAFFLLLLATH